MISDYEGLYINCGYCEGTGLDQEGDECHFCRGDGQFYGVRASQIIEDIKAQEQLDDRRGK